MADSANIRIRIVGVIWLGGDDVAFSCYVNGGTELQYGYNADFEEHIRQYARTHNMTVGDVCDKYNEGLRDDESKSPYSATFKFDAPQPFIDNLEQYSQGFITALRQQLGKDQ
jgi:hypothetical protein